MKVLCLFFSLLLASTFALGQSGFCLKYIGVMDDRTSDTLQVFNLNGDSFNQVSRSSDGQNTYRSLKLKSKPGETYALNTDNTYRMIPDVQLKEYGVTVLGKEQVGGYNCTKISLVTFRSGNVIYMWISDEVPDYKSYLSASVIDFKMDRLNDALKKQNLGGIPVKIAYKNPANLYYQLVSAQPCQPNASLFDLGQYANAREKEAQK